MNKNDKPIKTWKQKILKWTLELLVLVVLFNLFSLYLSRDMLEGQVKSIQTVNVQGAIVDNSKLHGETYLLYFWGSWCPVCTLTKGNIEFLSQRWPVISFAISSGDNIDVNNYLFENNLTFSTINDEQGYWSKQFNVVGVPAVFIVNKQGQIIFAEKGYSSTLGLWLKLMYADF